MRSVNEFLTNREIVRAAHDALSAEAWSHLVGASESETTARRNRLALDRIALRPRVLVGVNDVDSSTTFLGLALRMPVLLATSGDPAAAASAAATFGSMAFVNGDASYQSPTILEVCAHDDSEQLTRAVGFVDGSSYAALCIGLVPQQRVRRTRDVWRIVVDLADRARVPLIAKGVMNADDARRAVDCGCAAVYVSNYGGRALDHCQATIDALSDVVDRVDGKAEVIVDGGFMRATDVTKALALGARAVAIGRLQGFGLAAGGTAGLVRVLEIMEAELRIAMALLGANSVDAIHRGHVFRDSPPVGFPHATSPFFESPRFSSNNAEGNHERR